MKKINEFLNTDIGEKYALKDLEATREYSQRDKKEIVKEIEKNISK